MPWTEPRNGIAVSSCNALQTLSYSCLCFVFKFKILVWSGRWHCGYLAISTSEDDVNLHNPHCCSFLLFAFEAVRKFYISFLLSGGKNNSFLFLQEQGCFFFFLKPTEADPCTQQSEAKQTFSFLCFVGWLCTVATYTLELLAMNFGLWNNISTMEWVIFQTTTSYVEFLCFICINLRAEPERTPSTKFYKHL